VGKLFLLGLKDERGSARCEGLAKTFAAGVAPVGEELSASLEHVAVSKALDCIFARTLLDTIA